MPRKYASGLDDSTSVKMVELLNSNLSLVIDLSLAVKQAHWNLKGTGFIGVHELLDTTVAHLRDILDTIAERAVILGGLARGAAGAVVLARAFATAEPAKRPSVSDLRAAPRALGQAPRAPASRPSSSSAWARPR